MKPLFALLALLAAACGSSSPTTVPPPAPGLARVELLADSATVFQGRALPGQRLLARVTDSSGAVVSNATITAVASPGWQVRGDTVIAPAAEGYGAVRLVARRAAAASPALSATGAAPADSAVSDSVSVAATINLDTLHLVATPFMCRQRYPVSTTDSVGIIDSTLITLAVDSVVYSGRGPEGNATYLIGARGWAGELWLSGQNVTYGQRGVAHYLVQQVVPLLKQVPDTLVVGIFPGEPRRGQVVRVGAVPTYRLEGAPFCTNDASTVIADSVTLAPKAATP